MSKPNDSQLREWVQVVQDPEMKISIVDLGLVYGFHWKESILGVDLTLTSPACPMADQIVSELKSRLEEHPEVEKAEVNIVWEPKWDPAQMASEEAKEELGIW